MKAKKLLFSIFSILMIGASAPQAMAQCQASFTWTSAGATATMTNTSTGSSSASYFWDFGDGNYGYTTNASHMYNAAGWYLVNLVMSDSLNNCYSSTFDSVQVTSGCNIATIDSTGSTSACSACDGWADVYASGGSAPYTYAWSNGGTNSFNGNLCPGVYTVMVTDANGCSVSTSMSVTCPQSSNCQAAFTSSANGNTVTFNNTSSASNSFFTYYTWSYGDNSYGSGFNPGPHTYANPGTYIVCLTMMDSTANCTSTFCDSVVVNGPATCSASFVIIRDSLNTLIGYAYPQITGTAPFTYFWDFGDNTSSTQAYPTHTYATAGSYVICLTTTDANGCSSSYCDSSSFYRMSSANLIQFLNVMSPTGIQESSELVSVVSPNPASDQLNISLNKDVHGVLRLTDMLGKTVYEMNVTGNKFRIDTANFPEGCYNLSLQSENSSMNERVILLRK